MKNTRGRHITPTEFKLGGGGRMAIDIAYLRDEKKKSEIVIS